MQVILRWGHHWEGCHIIFHVNNTAIVSTLSSGMIWNAQVMNMLRSIVMLAVQMGFSYSSIWIPSIHNSLADAASSFEYAWLFQMAPSLKKKACPPLPQLRGIKCMLTYLHEWPSSCGMASPPRPDQPIGQDKSPSATLSPHPQFRNLDRSMLLASQNAVLEWVTWLGSVKQLQPKTINSYVTHLQSAHVNADLPFFPCESPLLQCII